MKPERWRQVQQFCNAALEHELSERAVSARLPYHPQITHSFSPFPGGCANREASDAKTTPKTNQTDKAKKRISFQT